MSTPSSILLIIRFTHSLPDLPLSPSPSSTPLTLVHTHIRPSLPPSLSNRSLRLIAHGALLPPTVPLSKSLRLPSPSPPTAGAGPEPREGKSKSKGKAKETELERTYIHCAIGDTALSPAALEAERIAATTRLGTAPPHGEDQTHHGGSNPHAPLTTTTTTTAPAPQGFDRLLSAGLTPADVAGLRSHFLALHAQTRTPDAMPSPGSLRALEEAWLDNDSSGSIAAAGTTEAGAGAGAGDEDTEAGALEDMLWGNVMGFFWAVGAGLWVVREEGVWSRRRVVGVVTGVVVNVGFGVWRWGGGG